MFTITSELNQDDIVQSVKLARAYYVDLINKSVKPHGPTSSLCMAQVEIEVREYLRDALTRCYGLPVSALLAKDTSTSEVIGFAVILGGNCPTDCGINYVAVHADHRRKGILREMLERVKSRFTHIGLACDVDKVPYYESLDFRVTGHEAGQVTMTWGLDRPGASMPVLDFAQNEDIIQATSTFFRVHGHKAESILRQVAQKQELVNQYTQGYATKRISGLNHHEAV
ncbi:MULTISPECIES: GNAT family N-acetyltransferase [Pseudomonas syringae group]|uniref:N-acetyltransferase domain-containing protein n=1 Tax=Pseudomonas cannabina TaxID=86840 RepID=A0A3M3K2E3_PSECA|nr:MULTISPECIES: GNAT family N-acetyltransferase [Pseudomonas syringae group]MDH4602516.1 GNAT family N-acetyltransferase [Pseudomonas syringae pv. papulans]RMN17127.1 hypothetical protein ALQ64_03150 [Pseudomonas cannabina]